MKSIFSCRSIKDSMIARKFPSPVSITTGPYARLRLCRQDAHQDTSGWQQAVDAARLELHVETLARQRRAVAVAESAARLHVADVDVRVHRGAAEHASVPGTEGRRIRVPPDGPRGRALARIRAAGCDQHEHYQ